MISHAASCHLAQGMEYHSRCQLAVLLLETWIGSQTEEEAQVDRARKFGGPAKTAVFLIEAFDVLAEGSFSESFWISRLGLRIRTGFVEFANHIPGV